MKTWDDGMPMMASVIPHEAQIGDVMVKHRTVTEQEAQFSTIRAINPNCMGRGIVNAGDIYAMLYVDRSLWMSDTPDERRDHRYAIHRAKGHVLIGGLGYGMVALACALKPEVDQVTVVEIREDVICLAEPHLQDALGSQNVDPSKLKIVEADIFTWKPRKGARYDMIWMDVWADICTDNLSEYTKLRRHFGRRKTEGGWMGLWAEHETRRLERRWQ